MGNNASRFFPLETVEDNCTTVPAVVIRLLRRHSSVFYPCVFPSQVCGVKRGDLGCSPVVATDGPPADSSGLFHYFPVSLGFRLLQRWREVSQLSRGPKSKYRPHCGCAWRELESGGSKGGSGEGAQRQAASQVSGSKPFITSRSWPLSTLVETTAFDCLCVPFGWSRGYLPWPTHAKGC